MWDVVKPAALTQTNMEPPIEALPELSFEPAVFVGTVLTEERASETSTKRTQHIGMGIHCKPLYHQRRM